MLIYYFSAILAAFLQSVTNFFWWPVMVVIVAAVRREKAGQVYLLSFATGLLTDLVTGKLLGQSAVYLLAVGAVIYAFKSRFELSWRWILIFLFLSQVLFHFVP